MFVCLETQQKLFYLQKEHSLIWFQISGFMIMQWLIITKKKIYPCKPAIV